MIDYYIKIVNEVCITFTIGLLPKHRDGLRAFLFEPDTKGKEKGKTLDFCLNKENSHFPNIQRPVLYASRFISKLVK